MNLKLKNKVALIIGASKDIGREISISLAKQKVNLIMVARSKKDLLELKKLVDCYSLNNHIISIDLSIKKNNSILIKKIKKNYKSIDIIVHNIGGSLGISNPFASSSSWNKVWYSNLGIAIDINNNFIPEMINKKWGRIVHISSGITSTFQGNSAYASAKCAVEGYIKSVSKTISKDNVIISGVAPGVIEKKKGYFYFLQKNDKEKLNEYYKNNLPINRMCSQLEVANAVVFLCSDLSSYMPGSIIKLDGIGN